MAWNKHTEACVPFRSSPYPEVFLLEEAGDCDHARAVPGCLWWEQGRGPFRGEESALIPDVSGMALADACSAPGRKDYHGGVRKIVGHSRAEPGTVLNVVGESLPGTKGGMDQVIMLQVVGPVSIRRLPEHCVSRIPGTF